MIQCEALPSIQTFSPQNPSSNPKSYLIPSSHIQRSSSFLTYKTKSKTPIFQEASPIVPIKLSSLISKYYGSKIVFIRRKSQIAHLYQKSKYFENLDIRSVMPENTANRQMISLKLIGNNFQSKRQAIIFAEDTFFDKSHLKKLLPPGQKRISIHSDGNLAPRLLRNMIAIKVLSLTIQASEFEIYSAFISNQTSLERIDLCLTGPEIINSVSFSALFPLKHLPVFTLKYKGGITESKAMTSFLLALNNSHVSRWFLDIEMRQEDFIDIQNCPAVFKKIDFLGLTAGRAGHDYLECDFRPEDLLKLMSSHQKVLNIFIQRESSQESINLNPILNHCRSLESLYISAVGSCMYWTVDDIMPQDGLLWTKNLKNVILNSKSDNYYDPHNPLDDQNLQVIPIKDTFCSLVNILKAEKIDLRSIRLFSCEDNFYYYEEDSSGSHCIESFVDKLENITTLEHIDLTFNKSPDKQLLDTMLSALKNLRKLDITFSYQGDCSSDADIPFHNLKQLSELRVFLKDNEKNHYEPYQGGWQPGGEFRSWGKHFAKALADFKSLEVLELIDHDRKKMDVPVFFGIMKACCNFRQLRRIVLHIKVIKEEEPDDEEGLMPDLWEWHVKESRTRLAIDIKKKVNKMIEMNPQLEEIDIEELNICGIECIKYER